MTTSSLAGEHPPALPRSYAHVEWSDRAVGRLRLGCAAAAGLSASMPRVRAGSLRRGGRFATQRGHGQLRQVAFQIADAQQAKRQHGAFQIHAQHDLPRQSPPLVRRVMPGQQQADGQRGKQKILPKADQPSRCRSQTSAPLRRAAGPR